MKAGYSKWLGAIVMVAAASLALFMLRTPDEGDGPTQINTDKEMMASKLPAPSDPSALPSERRGTPLPSSVDLDALKAKLPDNLYWQLSAPTDDPELLRARAEERKSWETLSGLIVSNTASEAEIDRYYDHQQKLSEDYVALTTEILESHGDDLTEAESGAYELGLKLHADKLREIPRRRADAKARKLVQDKKREEWRKGQGQGATRETPGSEQSPPTGSAKM